MALKLLVDPLSQGAYFSDTLSVAVAELRMAFPHADVHLDPHHTLQFVDVDLPDEAAPLLARMSWVQGIFAPKGDSLSIVDADPGFRLPRDLVWGAKYRGKTHELVTQLAIQVALSACSLPTPRTLLDPMAGRGTTLLWGLRYGLESWGVERDPDALDHVQRDTKRQTKLHRLKHTLRRGGKRGKDGAFLDLRFPEDDVRLRLVTGDSRHLPRLVQKKRFDLIVSDLPYGVQFVGPKGARNPIEVLRACAPAWAASLNPGGAMVLIYNRLQPARAQLATPFVEAGLALSPIEMAHRMSESILRDLLVLTKPEASPQAQPKLASDAPRPGLRTPR